MSFAAPPVSLHWLPTMTSESALVVDVPLHSQAVHRAAIAELVESTRQPLTEVEQVYEAEFTRLKSNARVTDYLVLFAVRRTRDALLRPRS